MPRSEAQKRADKKYLQQARASGKQVQLNVTVTPAEKKLIDDAVEVFSLSRARLIVAAVKYCLNNDVDLSANQAKDLDKTN